MPDTGAPWNIPYVAGTDLVADWPTDNQTMAEAIADALDDAYFAVALEQDYTTVDQSVTSTSYVDVTGASITITPKSADSRFLLLLNASGEHSGVISCFFRFRRDTTDLGEDVYFQNGATYNSAVGISFLDAPATTSPITYTVRTKVGSGTFTLRNSAFTVLEVAA